MESEQLTYITLLMIWGSLLCRRETNFTPPQQPPPPGKKEGPMSYEIYQRPNLERLWTTGDTLYPRELRSL